ncbi:MAG TPA: metallophosphoesterase [Candidatus Limiplasma sp.]|nr:metallophosphoesterase [Candidatus Limiplasma sp.]HRX07888.1 metallophosphoesterase [Candidatus Limiplasma sp.]
MRKITRYVWHTGKLTSPMRLLVVSDLHNGRYEDILPLLSEADVLLMPGDLAERHGQFFKRGIAFLREATQIVPVYLGIGNHEMRLKTYADFARQVEETGTKLLFNTYERFGELVIGCWYRPKHFKHEDMLPAFQAEEGCRVLMSHRPEDYAAHLADKDVDLVLSGHAHGGQWRFFGHGVFAPGQGLFPKYTKGIVDKMIISAGAGGNAPVPRILNPKEILLIELD